MAILTAIGTKRRNAQRMEQWKAKREAVDDNKTCVQTQTDDINPSTDEMNHCEMRLMPIRFVQVEVVYCNFSYTNFNVYIEKVLKCTLTSSSSSVKNY
jgi:hypothetical protein